MQHPGRAQFRIDRRVEVRAEGTVVIRPDCAGEKDAVVPCSLLLQIDADRGVLRERFGSGPDGPSAHGGDRNRGELRTRGAGRGVVLAVVLEADRAGHGHSAQVVIRGARIVHRDELAPVPR